MDVIHFRQSVQLDAEHLRYAVEGVALLYLVEILCPSVPALFGSQVYDVPGLDAGL